jgi:hypothetical protein
VLPLCVLPPFITTATSSPPLAFALSRVQAPNATVDPSCTRSQQFSPEFCPSGRSMTTTRDVVEQPAVPRVVSILSALLQRVAERNDAAADEGAALQRRRPVSAFQGLTKPAISIGGYLERIFRFASCSPSCYVVAYIYLDRFLRRWPALAVDSFNVHRLLITSVLTAVKFVDDMCVLLNNPLSDTMVKLHTHTRLTRSSIR